MHEYNNRVLHSIFNHHKDIVYRRSSAILISVIRVSYRKIYLYECPFNIQRRLGLGVAYMAILVKVRGSSLGKLFIFFYFFFILNKKTGTKSTRDDAMIFMCDKECETAIFWTETVASDNNRPLNFKSKQTEIDLSSPTGAKREPY